jgi:uncharacterized membrane protein YfcA
MLAVVTATLFFGVALLYSSVGFGGASSYLAVMGLFNKPPNEASTIALSLNILVAGIAFLNYNRGGHLRPYLLWPFLVTSIPAAFLGGLFQVSQPVYTLLLNIILFYVAMRLLFFNRSTPIGEQFTRPALKISLTAGALLGLVSGIIGVGGGIFLSPLIVLAGWGDSRQASTSSAVFVVLNSISGLAGRAWGTALDFGSMGWLLIPVGVVGGVLGSSLGSRHLSCKNVQRLLAVVLLVVVGRNMLTLLG